MNVGTGQSSPERSSREESRPPERGPVSDTRVTGQRAQSKGVQFGSEQVPRDPETTLKARVGRGAWGQRWGQLPWQILCSRDQRVTLGTAAGADEQEGPPFSGPWPASGEAASCTHHTSLLCFLGGRALLPGPSREGAQSPLNVALQRPRRPGSPLSQRSTRDPKERSVLSRPGWASCC